MSDYNNYIISACDKKFYKCLTQLIYTYKKHHEYENSGFICFDLGLDDNQREELAELSEKNNWFEVRTFDFSKDPAYYDLRNQNYAWKPTLIHEVFEEKKCNIFYLDSANIIIKNLKPIWNIIQTEGTYAPLCGSGSLKEWTLQDTLDYMEVSEKHCNERNRAGNTIGFSYHKEAVRSVVSLWKDLAMVEECIYPKGATRYNHKSDQSILTILLLQFQEKGEIKLTEQEVDISSSRPTKFISVRKKVGDNMILPVGLMTYTYFLIQRRIDILVNKLAGN